jgi:hypothetical protein
MISMQNKLLLIALLFLGIPFLNAQKEETSKDLSFLRGQRNLKLEFSFEGATINGDSAEVNIQKRVENANEKEAGSGDKFLSEWKEQKATDAPMSLASYFRNNLAKSNFVGVMDFDLPIYGTPEEIAIEKAKSKPHPRYVCVVSLVEIKTGSLFAPTILWLKYTFYENDDRDHVLATFKYHFDYAKDQTHTDKRGSVTVKSVTYFGSWIRIDGAYSKGGKYLAKKVKKAIR